MIRVNLCIEEEVDEQETEMKTKEKAREQFKNKIIRAVLTDFTMEPNDGESNYHGNLNKIINCMSWSIQKPPEPTWSTKVDQEVNEYIKEHLIDNIISESQSYNDITKLFNWNINHSDAFTEMSQSEYRELEALDLIHELSGFEEEDQELIGHGDIADQLSNKAAWTYSNAVYFGIEEKLRDIADAIDIDEISLDVADNILIDERSPKGYDDMEDSDVIEYAKEHYEDEFDKKLEDALRERVLEEL